MYEGLEYDEFVVKASHIDQVLIKSRKKDKGRPTIVSKGAMEGA